MVGSGDSQIVFQCFDTALAATTPDVLGLWATLPTAPTTAVAFGTVAAPMTAAPVWRASFPADLDLAEQHLASGEMKLRASLQALSAATDRLRKFIEAQQAGMAYSLTSIDKTAAQPEAELAVLLRDIREGPTPVSFGLGEMLGGGWGQATQQFQIVLGRLQQLVAHYVWVETRMPQELLGQTAVSWTGDMDTVWRLGLSPEQMMIHQRTLALALQSRDTLLQMVVMSAQFALKLSMLLSMPGGVILALPAAWKFINQLLAEFAQQEERREKVLHG